MFDKFGVVDEISVQLIKNTVKTRKIHRSWWSTWNW